MTLPVLTDNLWHKYGYSAVVGASWTCINLSDAFYMPQTPTQVRIKAGGSANDTAAGSGARAITIAGIDGNGDLKSEVLATAGASASALSANSYLRVFRAFVSDCGSYLTTGPSASGTGSNAADVVIENAAGTANFLRILAGEGQSQCAHFMFPRTKDAKMFSVFITQENNKPIDVRAVYRPNTLSGGALQTGGASRVIRYWSNPSGVVWERKQFWLPGEELADIWFEAKTNSGPAVVSVSWDFELVSSAA